MTEDDLPPEDAETEENAPVPSGRTTATRRSIPMPWKDVARAMVRQLGLHDGHWQVFVGFQAKSVGDLVVDA